MVVIRARNLLSDKIDCRHFKKITGTILEKEASSLEELSIVLVGPEKIKKINKQYRGKEKATDVLSFFYGSSFGPNQSSGGSGEIFICLSEVKKNAERFNLNFQEELDRVLIHGILHILGYRHEKVGEKKRREMKEKEKYYFKLIIKKKKI
jgi:probable rRNA maturation factor